MKSILFKYINGFYKLRRGQKAAVTIILLFVLIGIFSPIISNNRPIICDYQDEIYFPVFSEKAIRKAILRDHYITNFKNLNYEWALWPLIRYVPSDIDDHNAGCVSPFGSQNIKSIAERHFLGTDELGRDIAAGIIHGSRIALWVGLGASIISFIIGIFLGLIGGYIGDHTIQWRKSRMIISLGLFFMVSFWIFYSMNQIITHALLKVMIWTLLIILSIYVTSLFYNKSENSSKKISIPLDFIIQRLIEIVQSIPGFFIMLLALILVSSPSVVNVILIIGFLRWPRIAQYVRAESLRLKQMSFIKNAQLSGHSSRHIIWYHILPSVMTSIVVHISFGIGSAILIESAISFLGLGLGTEHLTWGAIISESRKYFYAWWLAIFPGLSIFAVVYSFNILGEMILDNINPLRK